MSTLDAVRRAYLDAVLRGDRRAVFAIVDEARGAFDIRTLYEQLFVPVQREIGELWQANRITVADEHLATSITQAAMTRLYDELFAAAKRHDCTIVAACADNERHELGLRMFCDLMELEGWDTCYLGATVPLESLVATLRQRRPRALALSTSLPSHLPRLQTVIAEVRQALGDDTPVIMVGGRPFFDDPTLATRIGADFTATDARAAAARLEASA